MISEGLHEEDVPVGCRARLSVHRDGLGRADDRGANDRRHRDLRQRRVRLLVRLGHLVGPKTELTLDAGFAPILGADFGINLLTLTNLTAQQLTLTNSIVVFADTTSPFTAATVQPSSSVSNFGMATLDVTNRLRIQFSNPGTSFASGGSIGIALAPAAAVPELGTWAMFIAGFGLVGATARRRKTALRFTLVPDS